MWKTNGFPFGKSSTHVGFSASMLVYRRASGHNLKLSKYPIFGHTPMANTSSHPRWQVISISGGMSMGSDRSECNWLGSLGLWTFHHHCRCVNTTLIFRVSVALRSSNWATEIPPFHRLQMGYPPVPCFIIVFPINFARIWDYINYIHHFSDTPTSPTSYIYNNIYIYLSHDFKNILVIYQELFAVETPFHHPSPPGNAKKPPIHGSSHLINHRCRWMPGKAEGNFNSLGWAEFG
jgi:hypothetical protein